MPQRKFRLHGGKKGAALAIRVTPRAKKDEITGILDDGTVKIRLTAPPVEGKANIALVVFLAKILDVPRRNIEIVAGSRGRDKLVSVLEMDANTLQARLLENVAR